MRGIAARRLVEVTEAERRRLGNIGNYMALLLHKDTFYSSKFGLLKVKKAKLMNFF